MSCVSLPDPPKPCRRVLTPLNDAANAGEPTMEGSLLMTPLPVAVPQVNSPSGGRGRTAREDTKTPMLEPSYGQKGLRQKPA